MDILIYIASAVAVISTAIVITRTNAVHALLYLIVSLMAVAVVFYLMGAPFVAALEVIIYAGAIMVLFIFVVMMLNLGAGGAPRERTWLAPSAWIGPGILALLLLAEILFVIGTGDAAPEYRRIDAKEVGIALFGPYVLAVELSAMLLLAGIVGAYHLGRHRRKSYHRFYGEDI
ncbi:MAG: NADH-quinone oxidoreductase subunit J [Spirochaetes bacterium]|nr:MAG: NADH-quinone oxidoreductase subunit J [Spirochaetota bacterium]